jgi:hypothetical protein
VVPTLAAALATGGESSLAGAVPAAVRAVPVLGRIATGIATGAPTAAALTTEHAANLPDNLAGADKAKAVGTDLALNLAMAGLPVAIGKSALVRALTGGGIGYGASAASSALQGQDQDQASNIVGGLIGALMGQHGAEPAATAVNPHLADYMRGDSTPASAPAAAPYALDGGQSLPALPRGADFTARAEPARPAPPDVGGPVAVDAAGTAYTPEQGRSELGNALAKAMAPASENQALPAPSIAVDRAGTAMTSADFLAQARQAQDAAAKAQEAETQAKALQAAEQSRKEALGITPDIERSQGPRWDAQQSSIADRQAMQDARDAQQGELAQQGIDDTPPWWMAAHGAELDHQPAAEVAPKAQAPEAATSPALPASEPDIAPLRQEIGWDQVGGKMLRNGEGSSSADDPSVQFQRNPGGDVAGHTTWVGKPGPDGESNFWRMRPEQGGKITEAGAHAAMDKHAAGQPLNARERRFIEYAQRTAKQYDDSYQAELKQHQQDQADMTHAQLAESSAVLRDAGIHPQDHAEALTVSQLVERAYNAGADPKDILDATFDGTTADQARALWNLTHQLEQRHGTDTGAVPQRGEAGARPQDQGLAAAGAGRLESDPGADHGATRAHADAERPAQEPVREVSDARNGLFGAPKPADHLDAATRAKDAQRNGLTGGKADTGDGGLFDGPRPEQVRVPDAVESTDAGQQLSIDQGNADADRLGLRAAVDKALGPVASRVEYLHGYEGLPADMRKGVLQRNSVEGRKGQTAAMYSPSTGRVFVFTDVTTTPSRALWHAAHEIAGHEGLRALLGDKLNPALGIARQNPTVAKLADEIHKQRNLTAQMANTGRSHADGLLLATEEALAELAAAVKTGDYENIKKRYNVDVPPGIRERVQAAVANFLKRLKAMIDDMFGKHTFSDEDVRSLLDAAWEAVQRKTAGEPTASVEHRDGSSSLERVSSVDSSEGAVEHPDEPNRPSILEPLDHGAETFEHLQDMPSRRPGESQSDYTRRVMNKSGDEIKAALSIAKDQRAIGRLGMRAMWAKQDRGLAIADRAFAEYRTLFDKEDQAINLRTIDQWENGQRITDADARRFFDTMKEAFDQRTAKIQALAPDAMQQLVDHYFPHIWEDSSKAMKWYQSFSAKRPLQGDRSFLKQRVHATIADGMATGLKPVSTNPVDLAMLKLGQMDKFIAFHEFRADLAKRGWLRKMEAGERVPAGYARVEDPAFQIAGGLQGYYAVPELIAKDINNYLAPSLYRFGAWKALRTVQNVLMSSRLGLSMFHGGFTTMDNMVMHVDVAGRRMMTGDLAGGVATLLKTPLSVVWSPIEGGKLNRQWLGLKPSDVHTAAVLDMLEQGGAHMKMSATDYNNAMPKLVKAFRQKSASGTLKQALPALGESISWVIHHWLVPNQKMAARVMLAKFELDRHAGALGKQRGDYAGITQAMHPDALKQIAAHVVDLVDDRLGQMNYDNQFWNKTAREATQAAIGAVGWQVGTLRTVSGGARDLSHLWSPQKLLSSLDEAGNVQGDMGRVSGRLTYLITLALMMGGLSAVTQWLLTGEGPQEAKDYFFPKTGNKNDDGSDERLQWPSYWSDHYKLATHPIDTAIHKISPSISMLMEALSNQDYYGTQIRNPDDAWYKQAGEVGMHLIKGFVPYSITGADKLKDASAGRKAANFFGITKAPASVSRSPFEAFVADKAYNAMPKGSRTQEQADHAQAMHAAEAAVRKGQEPDMAGLSEKDRRDVDKAARMQIPMIRFKRLSIEDKLRAYDLATPKERDTYELAPAILRSGWHKQIRDLPEGEQDQVLAKIQALMP